MNINKGDFILGDCLEKMKDIPDNSIDLILCDLPYGTTQNKWDAIIPFEPLWKEYTRVCKDTTPVVLTASQPFTSALVMSNPSLFKYEWIWVKSRITGVLNAKKMPVRKHEQVLVFYKKQPIYNPQGLVPKNTITKQGGNSNNYGNRKSEDYIQEFTNWPRDVLEINSEGYGIHPTQKPVALFEYLVKTYTHEGMKVLDNCAGSGTSAIACENTNRKWICIEKDEAYYNKAIDRIKNYTSYPVPGSLPIIEG